MTATPSIDLPGWMAEQLSQASPDLLRNMIQTFAEALMSADADAICGAGYGQRSPDRSNTRNGDRRRGWDTRAGSIDLAIPRLREGSYFPEWLLERRRRAESALISVVATSYLLGVSTRRMEKLVEQLGITRLSKSQVSEMARDLDGQVEAFRTRPLDAGPYTFVAADALVMKGPRSRPHGQRARLARDRGERRRLPGDPRPAGEQRRGRRRLAGVLPRLGCPRPDWGCPGHLRRPPWPGRGDRRYPARRQLATVPHPLRGEPDVSHPKSAWGWVKALLHSVYDQPDTDAVHAQFDRILDALADKLPAVAQHLDAARADILAFTAFPKAAWRQIWSTNPVGHEAPRHRGSLKNVA
jgi:putative transposase